MRKSYENIDHSRPHASVIYRKHPKICQFASFFIFTCIYRFKIPDTYFLIHTLATLLNAKYTAEQIKFSIKDFFSKCDQIRSFLWNWSHLMKKSLLENFIFCAVIHLTLIKTNLPFRLKTYNNFF